jgi:hypothetical protein
MFEKAMVFSISRSEPLHSLFFKRQIADLRLIFKLFVSPKGPGINYPSIFQMVIHDLKRCNDHSSPFPELSNHIYTLKDLILLIA